MISADENHTKTQLIEQIINLNSTVTILKTELDQLKRLIYGSRSERFVSEVNPEQTTLALNISTIEVKPAEKQTIIYEREKKSTTLSIHTGRNPLPAHLPRVEIIIEPQGDVSQLRRIGKEITEQLEFEPGKFFVK